MNRRPGILNRIYKFLYSTKLALYVFFLIAAAAMAGSYTTRSNLVEIPENITRLEKFFRTYDIFHSWWFTTLLAVFAINLVFCVIHNFIPHLKIFFSKDIFNEKGVASPWIQEKIKARGLGGSSEDDRLKEVKQYLGRKGYKIHNTPKGVVAEKGRFSRLLPFLFHLSILIILIGAIIGSVSGFVGTTKVHVKTETNSYYNWTEMKDASFDFDIRVDDFFLEHYPVPIRVGILDRKSSAKLGLYELKEKESFAIAGSPYRVFIIDAVVDSRFGESRLYFTLFENDRKVGTFYSNETAEKAPGFPYELVLVDFKPPRIPKVMKAKLQIKKAGEVVKEGAVEVNHPLEYEGITFYETMYDRDQFGFLYVGFQMVSDPGLGVVYTGFALMFASVIPIFYVSHKKIYITLDDNYITLTGEATKDKKGFKEEFIEYVSEMKSVHR